MKTSNCELTFTCVGRRANLLLLQATAATSTTEDVLAEAMPFGEAVHAERRLAALRQ